MFITDVKAYPLAYRFDRPIKASYNPAIAGLYDVLVEIDTDEGITGYGECDAQAGFVEPVARIIDGGKIPDQGGFKRLLVGRDPFDVEVLWETMFNTMRYYDSQYGGFYVEAMSGVDIALWDIIGKALRKPVHKLLGGAFRTKLQVYQLVTMAEPEHMAEQARQHVSSGCRALKVKIGQGEETLGVYTSGNRDIKALKAIRQAVGDDIDIGVDANSAFEVAQAKKIGRQLEELGVRWFEEPIPPDDLDGYIELSRALDIYIAAGENLFTPFGFRDFIQKRAVDIIQPDVKRCGGITAQKQIAQMAWANDILYQPHTTFGGVVSHAAELQVSAAVPNFTSMELMWPGLVSGLEGEHAVFANPFAEDPEIVTRPLTAFDRGFVDVPTEPGLGVHFDPRAMVAKYKV